MTFLKGTPQVKVNGQVKEMERLTIGAAFKLLAIVRKIGISESIQIAQKYAKYEKESRLLAPAANDTEEVAEQKEQQKEALLLELLGSIAIVLDNISDSENEIANFGSLLVGIKASEFATLPIDETLEILVALKDHPDLKAFTASLQKLMKAETKATATIAPTIANQI